LNFAHAVAKTAFSFFAFVLNNMQEYHRCARKGVDNGIRKALNYV